MNTRTQKKDTPFVQAILLVICLIVGSQTCTTSEETSITPSMQGQQVTQNP